jgi:hypothetical protein
MIPSVVDFPYSMFAPLSYTFDQVLWKFLFSFKKETRFFNEAAAVVLF